MYRTESGDDVFIVDSHIHFWDASPENWKDEKHAEGWINCFYDYHANLSPDEHTWTLEEYRNPTDERMVADLFETGHVDKAVLQPTYLKEFYHKGFNTVEQQAYLLEKYPGKFILNGRFDPRDGAEGLARFRDEIDQYQFQGAKLYTAEWRGDSKGWKLSDPEARPFFDLCVERGVKNIHLHKGPTIWPLTLDAFDVTDVDVVATEYRDELNFVVEHCGLPRIEDFCWIATQEPNVYAGLSVVAPFIHAKPYYFAEVLSEVLWWVGEDRMMWASDYALWEPGWLIEKFWDYQLPQEILDKTGLDQITEEAKRRILGLNAAKLYDIPVPVAA